MYDASNDKVKDKCQTVERLERDLSKGDELVKCGPCYGDFNIYMRPDNIDQCSGNDDRTGTMVVPCGTDKKTGELKYPMCMWDASKREPKSECETVSKVEYDLAKSRSKKKGDDDVDMLLDCGFCDDLNLFEEYWEPFPRKLPAEIDGCDWDIMDTCTDDGKSATGKDDNYYPMCIWDDKKGEGKSKCEKVSKLNSMKKHEYLVGCGYCEDLLLV